MHHRVNGLPSLRQAQDKLKLRMTVPISIDNTHINLLKINKMKRNVENKIQIPKNAIHEGINSGIAKDFNAEKHLQILKVRMKSNH